MRNAGSNRAGTSPRIVLSGRSGAGVGDWRFRRSTCLPVQNPGSGIVRLEKAVGTVGQGSVGKGCRIAGLVASGPSARGTEGSTCRQGQSAGWQLQTAGSEKSYSILFVRIAK